MATSDDLIYFVLDKCGKVEAGQTPETEDVEHVRKFIGPVLAQIGLEGVAYISDEDSIEDAYVLPIAARVALDAGPGFGLPSVDLDTKDRQNREIRRLSASTTFIEPIRGVYL